MAVSLFFGLPGCGKTTFLAMLAYKALKKKQYKNVYTNVALNMPGVTVITNECIGTYELRDCLLLIDEATLFADNRAYKSFSKSQMEYFLLHRHRNADIVLFTQQWDGVDRKIRVITDRVFYIYKGKLLGHWFSSCYRIPYGIIIPDPKKGSEKLGEIIQGYSKPPLLIRLFFTKRIFRPRYYPFFNSWELEELPPIPEHFSVIEGDLKNYGVKNLLRIKGGILLRSMGERIRDLKRIGCGYLSTVRGFLSRSSRSKPYRDDEWV